MKTTRDRLGAFAAAGILVASCLGASTALVTLTPIGGLLNNDEYGLIEWELKHVPQKFVRKFSRLITSNPSREQEDAVLAEYFGLTRDIATLREEQIARVSGTRHLPLSDREIAEEFAALEQRKQEIVRKAEITIERRLTALLEEEGLTRSLPVFSQVRAVFPPVAFVLGRPPLVLVISPRDRIEKLMEERTLLPSDLSEPEILRIEQEHSGPNRSAAVFEIGGLALYPANISEEKSYAPVLNTAAHEWMHLYLLLFPLGRNYFGGEQLRTLNETVASMFGDEMEEKLVERYPIMLPPPRYPPPPAADPEINFTNHMRALREEVEWLLGQGRIAEAERLMEEKRVFFAEHGIFIRTLNQAYFAFRGAYATRSGSIDPIGPKMQELRSCSESLNDFINAIAQVTSGQQLEEKLLARC